MKLEEILVESKKIRFFTKKKKFYLENMTNESILFYIEEEPRYSYFKKFKRKLKIRDSDLIYLYECVLKGSRFKNIFLFFDKKVVVKVLKDSIKGLEIIRSIYREYHFLSIKEKKSLLELYRKNKMVNDFLEKELEVKILNDQILNACDYIENEHPNREIILENVPSYKLLQKYSPEDNALVYALLKRFFKEKNFAVLNEMGKNVNFDNIFDLPIMSLEQLAMCAYFNKHKYDYSILKKLDKEFVKENILESKKILSLYKFQPFCKEDTKKYIKENIWATDFLVKFFNMIKEYLSPYLIEIINELSLEVDKKIWSSFFKLVDRKLTVKLDKLVYNEDFFEIYMKSRFFKEWMFSTGVWYLDNAQNFIAKFTKRDDFEFYLTVKHPDLLNMYYTNGIEKSNDYKSHMKIYEKICKGSSDVYKMLSSDVNDYFRSPSDSILLQKIIEFFDLYNPLYYEIIVEFISQVLNCNSFFKIRDINKAVWNLLIQKPSLFKELLNSFYYDEDPVQRLVLEYEIGSNPLIEKKVALEDLEKYRETPFEDEALRYVINVYSASEIMDLLLSKFEDERTFFYKALLMKKEYDRRIFKLASDGNWIEKIVDNIFAVEDLNLFEFLKDERKDLLFDYCIRHKLFRKKYFRFINKKNCTVEFGIEIYKIILKELEDCGKTFKSDVNYVQDLYNDFEEGNDIYSIAVSGKRSLDDIEEDKIKLLYYISVIRPNDGFEITSYYFTKILESLRTSKMSVREYIDKNRADDINLIMNDDIRAIDFILQIYFKDKHFTFTVLDEVMKFIKESSQLGKYIILKNLDSSVITRNHINEFLVILIPFLHDTNMFICLESKRILNNIAFASPEMINLRSQLIQCLINAVYVKPFLETFMLQSFNHYLCLNSLNILIQVLRMHIKEHKEDVIFIMKKLPNIVTPTNFSLVVSILYDVLSKFVIQNSFYTEECVRAAVHLIKHDNNVSFDILIDNIDSSLRIAYFLVESLKFVDFCENNQLKVENEPSNKKVESVVKRLIKIQGDKIHISNNFLAYAPDLPIFKEYINHFIPILKEMFESEDYDKRSISMNAFQRIDVTEYLIEQSLVGRWVIRLNCLELFFTKKLMSDEILTVMFILKHDTHSVVRKRAFELWKSYVDNPNLVLRNIYSSIFEKIKIIDKSKNLHESLLSSINEIISKYGNYVKQYYEENKEMIEHNKDEIIPLEVILIECVKNSKFLDLAYEYSCKKFNKEIYKLLLNSNEYRTRILEKISKEIKNDSKIYEILEENSVYELYLYTKNEDLLSKLTEEKKIKILRQYRAIDGNLEQSKGSKKEAVEDSGSVYLPEHIRLDSILIKNIKATEEVEDFVFESDLEVKYNYLLYNKNKKDFGKRIEIFKIVFQELDDEHLQSLILKENSKYILEVSFKNIKDYRNIIKVILSNHSYRSVERVIEVMRVANLEVIPLINYLLYCYLYYENRKIVKNTLQDIYKRNFEELSDYKVILERICI